MYVQFPMVEWNVFLRILDEVRRATTRDAAREAAEAFRSTISKEEFDELRKMWWADECDERRFDELKNKVFFAADDIGGVFQDDSESWVIDLENSVEFSYDHTKHTLKIDWDGWSAAAVELLMRLSLFLPHSLPVVYPAHIVKRESFYQDGSRVERVEIYKDLTLLRGYWLPFVLHLSTLYVEAYPDDFGLPKDWREECLAHEASQHRTD